MSQYTMAGRVGGMRESTSIEFGVVSAGCRVQSAGSLLGGGVPKLAMSDRGGTCFARCGKNNTKGDFLLCAAASPRWYEGDGQAGERSSGQRSFSVRIGV